MTTFRTHYDNLKVTRDAPNAVIRAAYKALIQKYHPDIFDGTEQEALRLAKLIKNSYDVLIDSDKRAEHDSWISKQEGQDAEVKKQEEKVKQQAENNQQTGEQQKQNIPHKYLQSQQSPQHQSYVPVTNQSNNFLRYIFAVLACLVLVLSFGLVNKFLVQLAQGLLSGSIIGGIAGLIYVYALSFTWRAITKKSEVLLADITQRQTLLSTPKAEALSFGLSEEDIEYLGIPIKAIRYFKKYGISEEQLSKAISQGKIRGVLCRNILWVQDKKTV